MGADDTRQGPETWRRGVATPGRHGLAGRQAGCAGGQCRCQPQRRGRLCTCSDTFLMFRYRNSVCQLYLMKYAIEIIYDIRDMKIMNRNIQSVQDAIHRF